MNFMGGFEGIKNIGALVYFDEDNISMEALIKRVKGEENSGIISRKYREIFNSNKYGLIGTGGFFESPPGKEKYSFILEVYLAPGQILDYLRFEKELKNQGFDVRFSREGNPKFRE